ncbi:MAG: hypothetical protein HKN53_10785 [Maribacter sp.]|nr:hypothetical protein [Maribacter sp.]
MSLNITLQGENTAWHFPLMILVSFLLFYLIIRIVIGKTQFNQKIKSILILSVFVVILGMLLGKYGAQMGFKWWIYYPVPMLMTVLLPPIVLKMNIKESQLYLFLSFLSAPFIHVLFSFFLDWKEYMPFWDIPFIGDI